MADAAPRFGNIGVIGMSWSFRRALAAWSLCAAISQAAICPASAHPHVFTKVRAELIAKGGALVAIRQTWIFDEVWLQNQLLEHDKDNDGKLSREELRPLEEESRQTLELFRSFTLLRTGGGIIRVSSPRDVVVEYHGEVLGLTFTAIFAKPVPLAGSEALLEIYDQTFFSSFGLDGAEAVRFAGEPVPGCSIEAGVPASAQQMAAWRLVKKQMGPEWVDKGGTPTSTAIKCGKQPLQKSPLQMGSEPMATHQPASMR